MRTNGHDTEERESPQIDTGTLAVLNKSEIDQQIATAHQYPRRVTKFIEKATQLATLNQAVADECVYALPRGGDIIEGPSARLAEIVGHAWGNCRFGARIVAEEADYVVAQGLFHDLETNAAVTFEVKRRIVDRNNRRYNADMIAVTGNAACSIALRNAVLKGVPKALWAGVFEAAKKCIAGDEKTLTQRREAAMAYFKARGVKAEQVCKTLGVAGVEDIGLEALATLRGIINAVTEGDTTIEQAFGAPTNGKSAKQEPVDDAGMLANVKSNAILLGWNQAQTDMAIGQAGGDLKGVLEKQNVELAQKQAEKDAAAKANENQAEPAPARAVRYFKGRDLTMLAFDSGNTLKEIEKGLKRLGGEWVEKRKSWTVPTSNLPDFLGLCADKHIATTEVDESGAAKA